MADLIVLSELTPALLEKLTLIEKDNFGEGGLNEWTLPVVAKYGRVFVFKERNEIKGLAELVKDWSDSKLAFLIGFSLKKKYQGQGLGKIFLKKILKSLESEGILRLRLTVSPENTSALNLYQKFGFKKI